VTQGVDHLPTPYQYSILRERGPRRLFFNLFIVYKERGCSRRSRRPMAITQYFKDSSRMVGDITFSSCNSLRITK
jgi:hypothetical protein